MSVNCAHCLRIMDPTLLKSCQSCGALYCECAMPCPNTKHSGFVVKDSGARQQFSTGAQRDIQAGKGRFDLIPSLPIRRLAKIYEAGAIKYGADNWRKGIPLGRCLDSAMRHLNMLKAGEPTEDHAMQAVWNLFTYVCTLAEIEAGRLPKELDDRTPPDPEFINQ